VEGGFSNAVDLVRFIRKEYGDFFGIGVACYPEGHVSAEDLDTDIKYLKEKVDAGADFCITQLFYDVPKFLAFQEKCHAVGITCPIVPGIMPIQNYNGFKRMTSFCKTAVPQSILDELEPIKADDAAVKEYGINLAVDMCKQLLAAGSPGLHFYTLNLEKSVSCVLEGLGYVSLNHADKRVPWQAATMLEKRRGEEVRPIFWANRPKSYQNRTQWWDEFPNGRWGDARSPAFGDLDHHLLAGFQCGKKEVRRALWKDAASLQAVSDVFVGYVTGAVARLPWCESAVLPETTPLCEMLQRLNKAGLLTINSQPRVNGAPSSDASVGWGQTGGHVFQKAYLEFFAPKAALDAVVAAAASTSSIQYCAAKNASETLLTNTPASSKGVNAVTWGVFPGAEIVQPTVVDNGAFVAWKEEAFALWKSQWQSIYEDGSVGFNTIQSIVDDFYLINIVDNDFVNGDLLKFMDTVVASL
jgi:methylenetetrahydrofolate reductase (NADPH)